jgi:hypothetical protein
MTTPICSTKAGFHEQARPMGELKIVALSKRESNRRQHALRHVRPRGRNPTGKEPVKALGLNKRRDAEICIVLNVVLGSLDVLRDPLVRHGDANVKGAAPELCAPFQASLVESAGGLVHPVPDVALDKLGCLLLDRHAREKVCDASID